MNRESRRDFLKVGVGAGLGLVAISQIGCGQKSIETEIAIIQSTVLALKPLLPNLAGLLDNVSKVAADFNDAYKRGDFGNARTIFLTLDANISQLLSDIGADASPRVKLLVGLVGIALRAVAALLSEQATAQAAVAAGTQVTDRVEKLADPKVADALLRTLKH